MNLTPKEVSPGNPSGPASGAVTAALPSTHSAEPASLPGNPAGSFQSLLQSLDCPPPQPVELSADIGFPPSADQGTGGDAGADLPGTACEDPTEAAADAAIDAQLADALLTGGGTPVVPQAVCLPPPLAPANAVITFSPSGEDDGPSRRDELPRVAENTARPGSSSSNASRLPDASARILTDLAQASSGESVDQVLSQNGSDDAVATRHPTARSAPGSPDHAAAPHMQGSLPANPPDTKPLGVLPRILSAVGTAEWRNDVATHVNLMIDRGEQVATLRLAPDHLGPLEVRIAVREGETSLWFGAAHADTRQALELAMPRLRELLAGAGLTLGQSTISQGAPQDPRNLRNAMLRRTSDGVLSSQRIDDMAVTTVAAKLGLVDIYA